MLSLSYSKKLSNPPKDKSKIPEVKIPHCKVLRNNLQQLELITRFELCLDKKKADMYSLNFLQEFAEIKYFAQKNTIQSIEYCKS